MTVFYNNIIWLQQNLLVVVTCDLFLQNILKWLSLFYNTWIIKQKLAFAETMTQSSIATYFLILWNRCLLELLSESQIPLEMYEKATKHSYLNVIGQSVNMNHTNKLNSAMYSISYTKSQGEGCICLAWGPKLDVLNLEGQQVPTNWHSQVGAYKCITSLLM